MRWMLIAATFATALGEMAFAQRERKPVECRREIMQLCKGAPRRIQPVPHNRDAEAVRSLPQGNRRARRSRPILRRRGRSNMPYGADHKQRLDLVRPAGASKGSVIVVRPWRWLVDRRQGPCRGATRQRWANAKGWAFASANYRLVPAGDGRAAGRGCRQRRCLVRANAARARGIDPDRIVLMGHSAGAHLVALVGTNRNILKTAGVPMRRGQEASSCSTAQAMTCRPQGEQPR